MRDLRFLWQWRQNSWFSGLLHHVVWWLYTDVFRTVLPPSSTSLQGQRQRQHSPPKHWYPATALHGATTQKTMNSVHISVLLCTLGWSGICNIKDRDKWERLCCSKTTYSNENHLRKWKDTDSSEFRSKLHYTQNYSLILHFCNMQCCASAAGHMSSPYSQSQ
jgi:hypothetical protein